MTAYDQPIPMHRRAPTAGNYRDIPIHVQDPRYGEALVDARACGEQAAWYGYVPAPAAATEIRDSD